MRNWISDIFNGRRKTEKDAASPDLECNLLDNRDIDVFSTFLCDAYALTGPISLATLESFVRSKIAQHPDSTLLATLDWLDQAAYTSGHATNAGDLDSIEAHDLSNIDADAFEYGEHIGYLSTKSEFPIRLSNLNSRAGSTTFDEACGKIPWQSENDRHDFFQMNTNFGIQLEEKSFVQIVPTSQPHEAIAAFPNGYFTSDLSPCQNYAISERFHRRYGYSLFGIGASYISFMRDALLPENLSTELARDISRIYGEDTNLKLIDQIRNCIADNRILVLRYSE